MPPLKKIRKSTRIRLFAHIIAVVSRSKIAEKSKGSTVAAFVRASQRRKPLRGPVSKTRFLINNNRLFNKIQAKKRQTTTRPRKRRDFKKK